MASGCSRYTVVCAGCVLAIPCRHVPNNVPEPDGAAHQTHFSRQDNQVGAVSGGNAVILQFNVLALWWVIKFRPSLICPSPSTGKHAAPYAALAAYSPFQRIPRIEDIIVTKADVNAGPSISLTRVMPRRFGYVSKRPADEY